MSASQPLTRSDAIVPVNPAVQHRARVTALVAALFIALASALLPGAMPASQMVGSAFNPATTQVALNRDESEQTVLAVAQADREHLPLTGGGTDVVTLIRPGSTLALKVPYRAPAQPQATSTAPARKAHARPGAGPRAPPVLA